MGRMDNDVHNYKDVLLNFPLQLMRQISTLISDCCTLYLKVRLGYCCVRLRSLAERLLSLLASEQSGHKVSITLCPHSGAKNESWTSVFQNVIAHWTLQQSANDFVLIDAPCFLFFLSLHVCLFCYISLRKPGIGTAVMWQTWWWAVWSAWEMRWLWVSASTTKLSAARERQQSLQRE